MSILSRFRVWLADRFYDVSDWLDPIENDPEPAPAPPPPARLFDVAVTRETTDGRTLTTLAFAMREDEYRRLASAWRVAAPWRGEKTQVGDFWTLVNGKEVNQGLCLTDIVMLTAVVVAPEGEA